MIKNSQRQQECHALIKKTSASDAPPVERILKTALSLLPVRRAIIPPSIEEIARQAEILKDYLPIGCTCCSSRPASFPSSQQTGRSPCGMVMTRIRLIFPFGEKRLWSLLMKVAATDSVR